MPEARDRLSRPNNGVAEMYHRRMSSIRSTGILPDNGDFERSISHTPFRWGATPLTGGGSGQPTGVALSTRTTTRGGVSGRGLFGTPMTAYRRGGRSQNTPPSANSFRRDRGGRSASRSVLPTWYPRTPLGDVTHVVRAIERRRERLGDVEGQTLGSPTPIRMNRQPVGQDPSPSGAQLEHEISLVTPKPKFASNTFKPSALGKVPLMLIAIANQGNSDLESLTPQKKLLNSIDIVEKVVMDELHRMKRTPTAKRAEREKRVKTLMSMR